jgi:hypothetical protein
MASDAAGGQIVAMNCTLPALAFVAVSTAVICLLPRRPHPTRR